ncbi:hypothetical protein HAX54_038421, partial [Datura stramonium]|nr:hypothetical protein [Datura stramonium]
MGAFSISGKLAFRLVLGFVRGRGRRGGWLHVRVRPEKTKRVVAGIGSAATREEVAGGFPAMVRRWFSVGSEGRNGEEVGGVGFPVVAGENEGEKRKGKGGRGAADVGREENGEEKRLAAVFRRKTGEGDGHGGEERERGGRPLALIFGERENEKMLGFWGIGGVLM